jgi:hypothetical protein
LNQFPPPLRRENAIHYAVAAIASMWLLMLFSGYGILIGEDVSSPTLIRGEVYNVGGVNVPSELMPGSGKIFSCRYFTGRGVAKITLIEREGYNQCPFLNVI